MAIKVPQDTPYPPKNLKHRAAASPLSRCACRKHDPSLAFTEIPSFHGGEV